MSRDYSLSTIKKIFTLSGNVCAFPNCSTTMIDENLIIIGEICHIEGEKQTSARFNPNMTEQQRRSFDNLILLCPTHHTIVDKDPTNYTTNFLKQMRTNHQNKNEKMQYNIPDDILKIVNISVNKDEYSAERIHNLLGLYKELQGNETKKTWHDHFEYALKGLKLSSPISQDEMEVLNIVFQDILALKPDESTFQDLLLIFLDKIPAEIRYDYITKIKTYLESIVQKDFSNANLPRIYIYLNRSETETLDYLIDNADNFSNEDFNDFLRYVNTNLNKLAETKKLFLDYECKLWKMLNKAEKNKEEQPRRYENAKTLLNKFINITV